MPITPVQIRPATATDAQSIAMLLAQLGHPVDADVVPARLDALWLDRGAAFMALSVEHQPVGFLSLTKHAVIHGDGPVALITAFVIAEHARGKGVGRQLVETAKEWATQHHCVRLNVTSAERRADAHAFYPACGLEHTGRRFSINL